MGFKLIDRSTGNEIKKINGKFDNYSVLYEFDSGEEALLELVIGKRSFNLTYNTIHAIKKIKKNISIRGVKIRMYFRWRNYIFSNVGNFFEFVGEMEERKQPIELNLPLKKPILTNVDWELYSHDEKVNFFKDLAKSLNVYSEPSNNDIIDNDYYEEPPYHPKTTITKENDKVNILIESHEHVVYLLYCDETPNIFYIGRTGDITKRMKAHYGNSKSQNTKLKYEWIKYIQENNFNLKYKILDKGLQTEINSLEDKYIYEYINNKNYCVLNFTTPYYGQNDDEFIKKFNSFLYEKKPILINHTSYAEDIRIFALTSDVKPNMVYISHAKESMTDEMIKEYNFNTKHYSIKRDNWLKEISELNGNLNIETLTWLNDIPNAKLQILKAEYINKYRNNGYEIINEKNIVVKKYLE